MKVLLQLRFHIFIAQEVLEKNTIYNFCFKTIIVPQIYQSFTDLKYSNLMSIGSILKMGKLKYEVLMFSIRSNIVI